MLRDITIGQYFPGQTPVHRLDPRVKIILAIVYLVSLFFIKSFWMFIPVVVYIGVVVAVSEIPPRFIFKGLKPLRWIIIITFIINTAFTKGHALMSLGPVAITREGLIEASFLALRLILLVLGASLLTLTTSPIALTDGIESIFKPLEKVGFPAHELAMMMTIALRFIPTLLEETDKIMKAQIARGADFESGHMVKRAMNLVPLLVPLFINAIRRADELGIAMEARCYRGSEGRTKLSPLEMKRADYAILTGCMVFFGGVIAARYVL